MSYAFKNRNDIEAVLELIRNPVKRPKRTAKPTPLDRLSRGWIFLTPSGGIPAKSGAIVSKAACTPYYIKESAGTFTLEELKDIDDQSQTVDVFNVFSSAISGNAIITAKEAFGLLIADAEDCIV